MTNRTFVLTCLTPLLIFSLAFLAFPLIRLFLASVEGDNGWAVYLDIIRKPRYINTLVVLTVLVSLATTFAALAVSTTAGMFLVRNKFRGRNTLLSYTYPAFSFSRSSDRFFDNITWRATSCLVNQITPGHVVFAYSVLGLFLGYLVFFYTACAVNCYGC